MNAYSAMNQTAWNDLLAKVASGVEVRTDSRSVQPGEVFVAIPGTVRDGGEFIPMALSRGAAHVTFLDNEATAVKAIGENLRKLGEAGAAKVVRADATRPPPSREPCDLVFLDPPYRSGQAPAAITALADAGWMTPGCIVTVELAHNEDLLPPDGFEAIDERRYGAAKIVILKRTA